MNAPTRILVTGSRHWTSYEHLAEVLDRETPDAEQLAHGGCRGADLLAERWANQRGLIITAYMADWARLGRVAGPVRNRRMLADFQPHIVIAFKDDLHPDLASGGTEDMIRLALGARVPVRAFDGNGKPHEWLHFWTP